MDPANLLGQTLDSKYLIDRELGRGGMGTVYLATHIGTERPVAVKVISPQYMKRAEFVERFRREARAAGRLRHPNVVDVTDFGFTDIDSGRVAYLVMEYLDGCTLGEILEEEQNLPVGWTLDILEQVCSAVQEAHEQGIIHRDLKPDNIWLEPNQRGGYTVKVLDFGIAKLEAVQPVDTGEHEIRVSATPTLSSSANATFGGVDDTAIHESISPTMLAEAATLAGITDASTVAIAPKNEVASEANTAIFQDTNGSQTDQDSVGTKLISVPDSTGKSDSQAGTDDRSDIDLATKDLTKVGAVLGTPLYMSPEQCSGRKLDPRSDIYSLGVIAYQMLSGETPFKGDFSKVMEAHKLLPPPTLKAKKVRKKMKRVIASALSKDPEKRPQTAEALASELRSRSEGIFGLLRRAFVIYSERLGKYLFLATFFSLPMVVLTLVLIAFSFMRVSGLIDESVASAGLTFSGISLSVASAFCTSLIVATISWIVTQYMAVPLRPIRLRPSIAEARKKWKRLAATGFLTAVLPFIISSIGGLIGGVVFGLLMLITYPFTGSWGPVVIGAVIGGLLLALIGFFGSYTAFVLVSPVVMLENVGVFEALRRSFVLVRRSFMTAAGAVLIMFLLPAIIAGAIAYVVNVSAQAFDPAEKQSNKTVVEQPKDSTATAADVPESKVEQAGGWNWSIGGSKRSRGGEDMDMRGRLKHTFLESLIQIFWLPMQIFVFSFSSIIVALLYLKTRQTGGEPLTDLLAKFEETDYPRKKWQERVRQRLIQSGRLTTTSKP